MTDRATYLVLKKILSKNQQEAKRRIVAKLGNMPKNCADKNGTPTCTYYAICSQVRTYETGNQVEPLCALSDEELKQFVIPWSHLM